VKGYSGVAWRVYGWETRAYRRHRVDGIEERSGKVVLRHGGETDAHVRSLAELTPLDDDDYCGSCGRSDARTTEGSASHVAQAQVFRVVLPCVRGGARSEQEAEDKAADTAPDAFAVGVDATTPTLLRRWRTSRKR